jgi:hypothetical protein
LCWFLWPSLLLLLSLSLLFGLFFGVLFFSSLAEFMNRSISLLSLQLRRKAATSASVAEAGIRPLSLASNSIVSRTSCLALRTSRLFNLQTRTFAKAKGKDEGGDDKKKGGDSKEKKTADKKGGDKKGATEKKEAGGDKGAKKDDKKGKKEEATTEAEEGEAEEGEEVYVEKKKEDITTRILPVDEPEDDEPKVYRKKKGGKKFDPYKVLKGDHQTNH